MGYHSGFYKDAEAVLPELVNTVRYKERPLYFTGHSLAGAIAGILPQIWTGPEMFRTPYTFASPRFGTKVVADTYAVYVYVRGLDPVPHLPPKILGFRSSGWPPCVLPSTDRWLPGWNLLRHWKKMLPAHSMEQYRKLLGEECGAQYFPAQAYYEALKSALVDPSC